ncbi:MAG TPA: YfhO family protein, partial [Clostridiaceae bacterium]|nr:YfhO family protein [Clostridiaceae bacterium]
KLDGGKKRIHELGGLLAGTELQLEVELSEGASESGSFEARLARLDTGVLESLSREAQAAALSGFSMRDGRIEGRTASEEERVLFLSVPSDPGWTAYIDGEEAEIQLLDQALMALRIPAGEHQILMTFYPPGLNDGLLISGIALLILGLFAGLGLLLNRRKPEAVHEDEIEVEEEEEGDPGLTAGLMEEENVLTG